MFARFNGVPLHPLRIQSSPLLRPPIRAFPALLYSTVARDDTLVIDTPPPSPSLEDRILRGLYRPIIRVVVLFLEQCSCVGSLACFEREKKKKGEKLTANYCYIDRIIRRWRCSSTIKRGKEFREDDSEGIETRMNHVNLTTLIPSLFQIISFPIILYECNKREKYFEIDLINPLIKVSSKRIFLVHAPDSIPSLEKR